MSPTVVRAKNKDYQPSESQIAIAFMDFIRKKFPRYIMSVIKIDNENKCSWQEGKKKKRMGKVKGASDYFIAIPNDFYHGLWLEIKDYEGKESKEQKAFGMTQLANGYAYMKANSIDECMNIFERYLNGCKNLG